ncbi:uncharacterized protein LOC112341722 [Selaginella moellendorffii]|uniref:uncharacterized protein LOC112341722 n=1 Tax=Selaginella moellendorffii TaxID=88036 RepID=UPI000D1D0D8C|nr:uncharacterized protein LOC112341722 [Selaginella moellendorffii]|eukprot:XP_024518090.1 uncharacterized protein LOC112341722 [Selaginella moellendorffii]
MSPVALLLVAWTHFLAAAAARPILDRFEVSVSCDVCSEGNFGENSIVLPDVPVFLECKEQRTGIRYQERGITGANGKISMQIPSEFSNQCSVEVSRPPAFCSIPVNTAGSNLSSDLDSSLKSWKIMYQPSFDHHQIHCDRKIDRFRILASTNSLRLGPPDPPNP